MAVLINHVGLGSSPKHCTLNAHRCCGACCSRLEGKRLSRPGSKTLGCPELPGTAFVWRLLGSVLLRASVNSPAPGSSCTAALVFRFPVDDVAAMLLDVQCSRIDSQASSCLQQPVSALHRLILGFRVAHRLIWYIWLCPETRQ